MTRSNPLPYARYTLAAIQYLGTLIQAERKMRRMTAQQLAERLGINRSTVQRLEKGDPQVAIGIAFEACAVLGLPLFQDDAAGLAIRQAEAAQRLALLPKYARPLKHDDDDAF